MKTKKLIVSILILVLFFVSVQPFRTTIAKNRTISVLENETNIREGPGLSYQNMGQANKGDTFTILDEKNDWIEIQLSNNKKGWVANWLVSINESKNSPSTYTNGMKVSINTNGLRVRSGPGTSFRVLGSLPTGESAEVVDISGNWLKIHTKSVNGWVANEFVTQQKENQTQQPKDGPAGTVISNSVNVRSTASLDGKIVGKLEKGDAVTVLSQKGSWTEINFSGDSAWVSSQFVQVEGKQEPSSSSTKNLVGTITATTLSVREEGSLDGKIVTNVYKGDTFPIIEESNNWTKIEYKSGEYGWVASWFLEKTSATPTNSEKTDTDINIEILYDGTNIRKQPDPQSDVVQRVNQGENFKAIKLENDWYEISLQNGSTAFVAGWVVSTNDSSQQVEKPGAGIHLKNKTIVVDPGHGGRDSGTTGTRGTIEKDLTIQTAILLSNKLKEAGANVILTRTYDTYLSLDSRVRTSHYHGADAFISIHYDSSNERSVRGSTSYYYHSYQKPLASTLHSAILQYTNLKDRGARFGDYLVLRDNKQKSVLLELGYLSNPAEEALLSTAQYQEKAALGIYQGLARYFKN